MKIQFNEPGRYRIGLTKPVLLVMSADVKAEKVFDAEDEHAKRLIEAERARPAGAKKAAAPPPKPEDLSEAVLSRIAKIQGVGEASARKAFEKAGADTEEKQLAVLAELENK